MLTEIQILLIVSASIYIFSFLFFHSSTMYQVGYEDREFNISAVLKSMIMAFFWPITVGVYWCKLALKKFM